MVDIVKQFQRQLQKYKNDLTVPPSTAFIHWYVAAAYGKKVDARVTDGKYDGGIDALIEVEGKIVVLQSEWCDDLFKGRKPSTLSPKKYAQFDGLPEIFSSKASFSQFLKSVEPSLHDHYKKVHQRCLSKPGSVVWEITTLHRGSAAAELRLTSLNSTNIRYAGDNLRLFELALEGASPPASPFELRFTDHFIVDDLRLKTKSYVLRAYLHDFIKYASTDTEFRVLARNVRNELRDKSAKKIKSEIQGTYEDRPWEFW